VNEVVNDSCIPRLVESISSDQVLVLYYHDPTNNNELESEDKEHSEDVGNEEEKEEEEKEDVIVDSDYELREISNDDEDSDRIPSDGDSSDEFRIGMQFANKDELKEAIREYAIVQGRNVKLVKNDNKRIQAKCVGHTKCPFILFASKIDKDEQTFSIKTLSLEHECTRVDKLKYINSRWLSKRFADKIRKNPEWDVGAFQSEEVNVFDYAHDCYKKKVYLSSYEPMPGRPKKSRNKIPAEVEVPAPVPPNPLPPYYNPPPTKPFLISPTKEHLALLQSKGQLRLEMGQQKCQTSHRHHNHSLTLELHHHYQPPKSSAKSLKSPTKRFKSLAKKLRPWMF
ncbi:unnamed protein product, partial [Prunus brigantina]